MFWCECNGTVSIFLNVMRFDVMEFAMHYECVHVQPLIFVYHGSYAT